MFHLFIKTNTCFKSQIRTHIRPAFAGLFFVKSVTIWENYFTIYLMSKQASLHQKILQHLSSQAFIAAHPLVVSLIQSNNNDEFYLAEGYFFLGIINSELGQFTKAVQCLEKAVSLQPSAEYFAYMTKCYALLGDTNRAMTAVDSINIEHLKEPNALDTVGVALSRIGFHDQALAFFAKAIALDKKRPLYYYNYGMSLKFAGQFKEALAAYKNVLKLAPNHAPTHFAIADLGGATVAQNNTKSLTAMLQKTDLPVDDRMHLAHALALELQQIGQHEKAFRALISAKTEKLKTLNYSIDDDIALFSVLRRFSHQGMGVGSIRSTDVPKAVHTEVNRVGCPSKRPIFIVGMPRSGTTLVERILSHHSKVGSGGELQDFGVAVKELTQTSGLKVLDIPTIQAAQTLDMTKLGEHYIAKTQRIAPNDERFIDKLPFNFFYIQLIKAALPNAKVIVMLRDPMDTCVGNFRQLFSLNSPYYNYAFDLETVGLFYCQFRQHIDFVKEQYGDDIYLQDYQTLVQNPEEQVRKLLKYCNLPYEAQCLAVEKNTLPVSTASKMQVRQPINTSSIGRWKKFGKATEPLYKSLKEHGIL